MSYLDAKPPRCERQHCPAPIELDIIPRSVDLGGFDVQRVLPSSEKRSVGPFVFWDQAGPGEFLTGRGLDVRPHPHICLSTMTYLFHGALHHRDTLGSDQIIEPGDVNLMTAGRGIAHSERTPQAVRLHPHDFFGIQCWLALPLDKEEMEPLFVHTDKTQLPAIQDGLISSMRLVAGEWLGLKSPVNTHNDALFVDYRLKQNATLLIPNSHEERAVYLLSGEISIEHNSYQPARMLIIKPGAQVLIKALSDTHLILLGGSALEKPRFVWWNFVASSKERIEQAKVDWQAGRFGKIPGDEVEFIPLP